MVIAKSVLAGVVAAIVSLLVFIIGEQIVWIAVEMSRSGSGGIGAVSAGIPALALLIAPMMFVVGFRWQLRRARRMSRS